MTPPNAAPPPTTRELAPAGILGVLWATLPAAGGFYLLAKIGAIAELLEGAGSRGVAIYVAAFALASGLGLVPTYALSVLGGWLFGAKTGGAAALLGFTGGALVGWLVSRLVAQDRLRELCESHPKARVVRDALIGRGWLRTLGIVALLRVPPNMPFALSNLAMAGAGVPLSAYLPGTLIGMAPRTILMVAFAAAAASRGARDIQSFVKESDGKWLFIAGVATLVVVLAILARIGQAALRRAIVPKAAP